MKAESEVREINTGEIEIKFRGQSHQLDLMLLRISIEEAESQFPPKREGDLLRPTPEFLKGLAHILSQDLGIVGLTPTAAYQIWIESNTAFIGLKKSTE